MDEYSSEKEQIEEIKQWWKDNGTFIITGLVVGFGALGGWKYWQAYKEQRAATASARRATSPARQTSTRVPVPFL